MSTALEVGAKLKLFGPRVALSEVEEVNDTGLELPKNLSKAHVLCQVVAVGDGRMGNDVAVMWPQTGDVVLVQFNPGMVKSMAQFVEQHPLFVQHQNDCIARVLNRIINLENLQPLGRWVLVRVEFEQERGGILLPEAHQQLFSGTATARFYFEKGGVGANFDFKVGQEIYCDKTRVNVLTLNGKRYGYIDRDSIIGEALQEISR